jgi:ankyrin repeat protein
MWAAAFNRVDAVRCLLEHGVNRSRVDSLGRTAADHARATGATAVLPVLEG